MNYSRITSSIEHVDYIAVRYSVGTFLCINYEFLQGFKNISFLMLLAFTLPLKMYSGWSILHPTITILQTSPTVRQSEFSRDYTRNGRKRGRIAKTGGEEERRCSSCHFGHGFLVAELKDHNFCISRSSYPLSL